MGSSVPSFDQPLSPSAAEVHLISDELPNGVRETRLFVQNMHCGSCLHRIESSLKQVPGVEHVRANLSAKIVTIQWSESEGSEKFLCQLTELGFKSSVVRPNDHQKDELLNSYLKALAVSGFAAANIMLFSVSIWSGADASSQALFHWLSALIAIPALLYSAQVFYQSAWLALKVKRVNMDVPITIGISLTCLLSLYDTIVGAEHVYFEAAVMLVFFLLIGRTLDHMMRQKAISAVDGLSRLIPPGARMVCGDKLHYTALNEFAIGDTLLVDTNEIIPLDGWISLGSSEVDLSLVTGESLPKQVGRGSEVLAGTRNMVSPLHIKVTATSEKSYIESMRLLIETGSSRQGRHQRWADKAAQWYAPVVHSLALLSFIVWMLLAGDFHQAVTIAVAVLIITCPCAIGLAIPMVQIMASRRLFAQGVLMKDSAGLERLCKIDTVVFDKTGTLTTGTSALVNGDSIDPDAFRLAAQLAKESAHPYARAVLLAFRRQHIVVDDALLFESVKEIPGKGVEAVLNGDLIRFGKADWARSRTAPAEKNSDSSALPYSVLSRQFEDLAIFDFQDVTREDTEDTVQILQRRGFNVEILSGDTNNRVAALGEQLSVSTVVAGASPQGKAQHVSKLKKAGKHVLMIGDGLNDTIALNEADVSMTPGAAADAGRQAADFVFVHDNLTAIPKIFEVAETAQRMIKQNFIIAIGYNVIAIPFALAGYITPLVAALAMSASSIMVVGNALRLRARADNRSQIKDTSRSGPSHALEAY